MFCYRVIEWVCSCALGILFFFEVEDILNASSKAVRFRFFLELVHFMIH
jgi:hypothetical protein